LASDSITNDLALACLAEQCRDVELWPRDPSARAITRSASAEMHSGFQALRENCPMELLAHSPQSTLPPAVELDIHRIITIWRDCRTRFGSGGPFLFGQFSAADAMDAPVASRFRTYVDDLTRYGDDGSARAYVEAIFAMPEIAE
jgi:glutathione S-transferase